MYVYTTYATARALMSKPLVTCCLLGTGWARRSGSLRHVYETCTPFCVAQGAPLEALPLGLAAVLQAPKGLPKRAS